MSDDTKLLPPVGEVTPPDDSEQLYEKDEHEQEEHDYRDRVIDVDKGKVLKVMEKANSDGTLKKVMKARKSSFVSHIIHLDGKKFDFTGRNYLKPIYDAPDKQVLLKTARQVEKCQDALKPVTLATGEVKAAKDVAVGDLLIGIGSDGRQEITEVLASESNGLKKCLEIETRSGSNLVITGNHPLRKLLEWETASNLKVGDKVASLRTQGVFGGVYEPLAPQIGMMVGDGSYTDKCVRFTCKDPDLQKAFESVYGPCKYHIDKRSGTRNYYVSKSSPVIKYLKKWGLFGSTATKKSLPSSVFTWDKQSTSLLIRFLWATDGHCKNTSRSKVDIVYSSSSEILADQVRVLLRKFGILTIKRSCQPKKGKKNYILRVITRKSIESFYREIGPIPGKPFSLQSCPSNSNLDTLPKDIHEVIKLARVRNENYWKRSGLLSAGLRQSYEYCPTYEKVSKIQKIIKDPIVQKALDADIFWDEIVSIKEVGERETWAIQTDNETYTSDFVVNHNTTFLGNNLTINSVIQPYNKALYVSPSHTQTRQFSNEKLKPAIEGSPLIKRYFQDSSVSMQVFEKGFTNGAYVFLRSAFRSADRTRGISARDLCLDELQDFYISEIPVIMECTSHFEDASVMMAGTPKSLDNPIEVYWKNTTQNEWLVKCTRCNHWNFLDENNIAPTEAYVNKKIPPGPVCKKCEKPINPAKGKWFSFAKGKMISGYRIPQLMVPWIISTYDQWMKLLWKRDNYPFGQFANEVLGISYDNASKPITRDQLLACCDPDHSLLPDHPNHRQIEVARKNILVAGIDWGEGNDGSELSPTGKKRNASYTVLSVGYYIDQRTFKYVYIKRFTGKETDPEYIVKEVVRICNMLKVRLVGVDWGHGWGVNNQLVRALGPDRVVQFQYLPKQKERMKWDPIGYKYQCLRNLIISEYFYSLKAEHIIFPKWSEFEAFAKDILAVFTEYVEYTREMKYDHRQSDPDDFLHSAIYCRMAADLALGRKYGPVDPTMSWGHRHR